MGHAAASALNPLAFLEETPILTEIGIFRRDEQSSKEKVH